MPVADVLYPVNLVVAGRRCVVVGGGSVAARKVEGLVAAGADVVVIAPEVDDQIRSPGRRGGGARRTAAGTWRAPGWPSPRPMIAGGQPGHPRRRRRGPGLGQRRRRPDRPARSPSRPWSGEGR